MITHKKFKDWMFCKYEISEKEFESLSPGLQNYIGYLEFMKDGFFFYMIFGFISVLLYYFFGI